MQLKFFIPMKTVPTITHQEKKVRMVQDKHSGKLKPVFYEGDELKKARNDITLGLIKYGLPNGKVELRVKNDPVKRKTIFEKDIPISLNVKWCFGIKDGSKHSHGEYRMSKPDTDNLQKMLKDCMTACGFWYDDAQVVEEHIGKYWSDTPGIWIQIDSLK